MMTTLGPPRGLAGIQAVSREKPCQQRTDLSYSQGLAVPHSPLRHTGCVVWSEYLSCFCCSLQIVSVCQGQVGII